MRLLALVAASLLIASSAGAQGSLTVPPQEPVPPGFSKFGLQPTPEPTPKPPTGAPLFGQKWPSVGPSPPAPAGPNRCPTGYAEPSGQFRVPHLVVCVVNAQPDVTSTTDVERPRLQMAQTTKAMTTPVPLTSPVPSRVQSSINRCAGRPPGSYACGRGGTECCGPTQDNLCFAGAFACKVSPSAPGPKSACCLSR